MAFFDEEHLLLAFVFIEDVVYLLKGDEGILLGGDEDARGGDEADQRLEIHLVDIEVCLRNYNWFNVLICNIQQNLWQISPLLPYFHKQFFE